MKQNELREAIKLRAWVITRKRIQSSGVYEVRKADIYGAIAELANESGYIFKPQPIVDHVRHAAREWSQRSKLPPVRL